MEVNFHDRVGLGWRGEIAAHILLHIEQLDVLEVIAENYFSATKKSIRSLQYLAREIPVALHGVSMGLASAQAIKPEHIEKMARLVDVIKPEFWSEHLAFVRAGNIEIGHLAAPPRNSQTIEMTLKNIALAKKMVGTLPHVENIATLVQPPASTLTESEWLTDIVKKSAAPLLLDLHNLYANAKNFGIEPSAMLMQLPLDRVCTVHLSGGCWISEPDGKGKRLLDDHIHDVPTEVFDLLTQVATHAKQNLTVIIERDGNYPQFSQLLHQIELARAALKRGRQLSQGDTCNELC